MPAQKDVSGSIEYSNAAVSSSETAASSSVAAAVAAPSVSRPQTAAVIPAFNEAGRITSVLKVIAQAALVDEIIVVTDGCNDSTADEARGFMARLARGEVRREDKSMCRTQMRVFELEENIGKGGAMTYGALRTQAEVLLFLDADLIGLRPEQVDALLEPTVRTNANERMDMVLGLFGAARGGLLGWWLSWCNRNIAAITGQRSIRRDVFLAVPDLTSSRYGVEAAITRYVYAWQLRVSQAALDNVTHPLKEEKIGVWRGFWRRMGMYNEILSYIMVDSIRNNASEKRRRETTRMRQRFSDRS